MGNSCEYFEKRIADNVWKKYNSIEEKNKDLIEFYQEACKQIREELYKIAEQISKDGTLSRTEMYRQQRLQKLERRYLQIAYKLGKQVEKFASEHMQEGYQEVYKEASVVLETPDFAIPDQKLMEKLMQEPWRGSDFSSRLWENQEKLTKALNSVIRTGLQQGKTVTEMAINLNFVMGKGFNAAHRLVRTETMHFLNNAVLQGYKDAGIKKVQFWAAKDERTCKICGTMHGKIYDIDKAPVLPLHPNCRCTYLPVLDDDLLDWLQEETSDDIIISGARITDPESEEGMAFAKMYYPQIRKRSTDVAKIASNLGKDEADIKNIKDYLFMDKSLYDEDLGIWRRFDEDCAIAQSWQRLTDGKNIQQHDRTLIEHELLEMQLKADNPDISHSEAHMIAQEKYNYRKEVEEYYGNLD